MSPKRSFCPSCHEELDNDETGHCSKCGSDFPVINDRTVTECCYCHITIIPSSDNICPSCNHNIFQIGPPIPIQNNENKKIQFNHDVVYIPKNIKWADVRSNLTVALFWLAALWPLFGILFLLITWHSENSSHSDFKGLMVIIYGFFFLISLPITSIATIWFFGLIKKHQRPTRLELTGMILSLSIVFLLFIIAGLAFSG